ncbi:sensor histidine kinase [Umezawaea tangerina]|uniref:histidine kinase n=1 Tax=Umezawaea tangerina TaxID=84725 RepID=A0A2T0SLG0_9PSEU|nr:histidine kinase [Umezawaea tangerina]PRY34250.1 signal transduction histidine kinase [Umezawaea tangerina]
MGSAAHRRGTRDWVVDTALFLGSLLFGAVMAAGRVTSWGMPSPAWLFDADLVAWAVGSAGLWVRRRWPIPLALLQIAFSTFSELSSFALLVALFTVAVHLPPRTTMVVFALSPAASAVAVILRPEPDIPNEVLIVFSVALQGAAVAWGLVVHHRRQLILSLRDRAVRAETEAHLRAEQVQHRVREDIAREIHDVLGHRLSLLSVHAGALEYRPDAPTEDIARAARVIRENSHRALQDLREVIGVLRAPVGELPQPRFADLPLLVAESDHPGMRVVLRDDVDGDVPDTAGRTVYRIVQESMTNARRHSPGSEVDVRVSGAPGDGLSVEVVNSPPTAVPEPPSGQGRGLPGLAERVAVVGGALEHGRTAGGGWRVAAWLPWPP